MAQQLPVAFDPIRKQLFVENLTLGLSPVDATIAAGFEGPRLKNIATKLMEDADVIEMIEGYKKKLSEMYDVSRDKVLRDLVDAKEMARMQADPKSMVMALKEVSEVQGYHAPKQLSVDQTIRTEDSKHKMRQLPDDKLLELAEEADFKPVQLLPRSS